ncbi:TrmH family RNA methyltransferase [Actinospongicola halichondriae]|uniref:TrmH family RNA methyltransferase n=1 Tax=Actinospongicola halichondriae TaxID=3236844 RepID=UPI003D3CD4FE
MLGPRSTELQHLRRLSGRRRARRESGEFVVDGPTLVAEALASDVDVSAVYVEPDAPVDVMAAAEAAGVPVRAVASGALAKVTSPVSPQLVAALATIPPEPGTEVLTGLVLVLVGVGDPGNAGTIVRFAEAAGASAVVSCADAVDPWNPKCVRASAGSLFRMPMLDAGSVDECVALLRGSGMTLISCDAGARAAYDDTDLTGDVAVLLGNEAHGLIDGADDAADVVVSIPMQGAVESLNVAMTGAIVAFESARQRRVQDLASGPGGVR